MAKTPELDGRRRDKLFRHAVEIAPYYTEDWDPDDDAGTALLQLFAELGEEVTERLDRVPQKHRVAFYDTLGFSRQPPQAARLPLSVTVADGVEENVPIPAGTQTVGGDPEQTFEVTPGDGFEATPARLAAMYSVDPDSGEIYGHLKTVKGGQRTRLFGGSEGLQEHALYVGHVDQLRLDGSPEDPKLVRVVVATDTLASDLGDRLVWEFYGERDDDEGWHEIVKPSVDAKDGPSVDAPQLWLPGTGAMSLTAIERQYGFDHGSELQDVINRLSECINARPVHLRTIDLKIDGKLTETTVGDLKSRWIRCNVPESEWDSELFDIRIGSRSPADADYASPISVGPVPKGELSPDRMLTNNVEISTDKEADSTANGTDIYPLGRVPRPQDAFYVASEEVFTKMGATVAIKFAPPENTTDTAAEPDPEIAWEYWNGSTWARLTVDDGTDHFTPPVADDHAVEVTFTVPDDLTETSISGHQGYWIRARLVSGGYGQLMAWQKKSPGNASTENTVVSGPWVSQQQVDPPIVGGVSIRYVDGAILQPAGHLLTRNNLAYGLDLVAAKRSLFVPFVRLPDDKQTLYLGFDRSLDNGPINLLFDIADVEYPKGFHPRVRWERQNSGEGGWNRLNVRDGTESLTERGIVSLTFSESTLATSWFGQELHWLRARVTGDPFLGAFKNGEKDDGEGAGEEPEPCGTMIKTEPPAGKPGRERPTLTGLHRNTGWARNVRTITDELIGSSDGTQDQAFTVANPPATDVELWVDEIEAVSEGQREALRDDPGHTVETELGPNDEPEAFWVRWTAADSLLDSDGDDRHYMIDRATGRIEFGDGNRGRIPPRGRDNIRVSYRTGGGVDGNVPRETVSELKSSIPFVDAVTNPVAAAGGADEETVEDVLERAPKTLRDRGRAVTEADVERIALDASRQLARAQCLSAMDRDGEYAPGWVTLLVVPTASDDKPIPSVTLREDVWTAVSDRAAATLVADPEQLVVRGPSYVAVSVETTLTANGVGGLSTLEESATDAVEAFLHPLSGGPEGDGWPFGEPPCLSDFYALLEGVEGVDHVDELVLRFHGTESTVTVREGDTTPEMSSDALIHSGSHDIGATRQTGGS